MKHKNRIFRLVSVAIVSCVLAALLSGCTQEEFAAGFNEFMFGDWFDSWYSSVFPNAASSTTFQKAESDPDHVYDPPNAECDAKINALLSELYSLEAAAKSDVDAAIQAAKDEYHALPASERTYSKKVSIAYAHLSSVESYYDSCVSSIINQMYSILNEYNQPTTVADQAWSYYQSAKTQMISSLR